jgi:hypothetical protein
MYQRTASENVPVTPEDQSNNPESLKFYLQHLDPATGEYISSQVEVIIYWDKLEDLLIAAGHDASDLGYERTAHEKLRMADLAGKYSIDPAKYMRLRRPKR